MTAGDKWWPFGCDVLITDWKWSCGFDGPLGSLVELRVGLLPADHHVSTEMIRDESTIKT